MVYCIRMLAFLFFVPFVQSRLWEQIAVETLDELPSRTQQSTSLRITETAPTGYLTLYLYAQVSCSGPVLSSTTIPVGYCLQDANGGSEFTSVQSSPLTYIATITKYNDDNCQSVNGTKMIPFFNNQCPSSGFLFKFYYSTALPPPPSSGYLVNSFGSETSCQNAYPILQQTYILTGTCINSVNSSFFTTSCDSGSVTLKKYNGTGCLATNLVSTAPVLSPKDFGACVATNSSSSLEYTHALCLYNINSTPSNGKSKKPSCFDGSQTVRLFSGEKVELKRIKVGDRVLGVDGDGILKYSDVIAVPHMANQIKEDIVVIRVASGEEIRLTPDHLIHVLPQCQTSDIHAATGENIGVRSLMRADSVRSNMCLITAIESVELARVVSVERSNSLDGLYTIVTESEYLVVNGFISSPYSYSHSLGHSAYSLHRLLYNVAPRYFFSKLLPTVYARVSESIFSILFGG